MASVTATEASARLPELRTRVERGEEVMITRHGRPVPVLLRPDALRSRLTSDVFHAAAQVHDLLANAAANDRHLGLIAERADELVHEIRANRDAG